MIIKAAKKVNQRVHRGFFSELAWRLHMFVNKGMKEQEEPGEKNQGG